MTLERVDPFFWVGPLSAWREGQSRGWPIAIRVEWPSPHGPLRPASFRLRWSTSARAERRAAELVLNEHSEGAMGE